MPETKPDAMTQDAVAAVRQFNRFYTRAIGVLDKAYLGSPYTLAENRVLYEIANGDQVTPGRVAAELDLDPGYLSRMLARLERDGLVARQRSACDGRSVTLGLTLEGRRYFDGLNARTVTQVKALIGRLSPPQRDRLTGALNTARTLLDRESAAAEVTLRPHRPGDMGWIVERHALLYGQEYGWSAGIEAVTARVCADFLDKFDPARERCWIAECSGERLGSVFLVKETDEVARLRLLLLDPSARGLGPTRC